MAAKRAYASVNLMEPAFVAFREFAATAYPGMPLTAALREAALVFMGTDPLEASKSAARRAAWLSARVEIATVLGNTMARTAEKFATDASNATQELTDLESQGLIPPNPRRAA